MPNPEEIFEHPEKFWAFLTKSDDRDVEGQHLDHLIHLIRLFHFFLLQSALKQDHRGAEF